MMYRYRYPRQWEQLAHEAKERAGWKCALCGIAHGTLLHSPRTGNPYIVYLQAAHVNHDHQNPEPVTLAVCPTCHSRYYRRKRPRIGVYVVMCQRRQVLRKQFTHAHKTPTLTPDACRPGTSVGVGSAHGTSAEKVNTVDCRCSHSHSTKVRTQKQTQEGA